MGIGVNKFEEIKNKARKMIHDDAKSDAHIIKERMADRNNPKFFSDQPRDAYSTMQTITSNQTINESTQDYSEDKLYSAMDSKMNAFLENRKQANYNMQVPVQSPTPKNKSLPKEILESFSNNYIDQSAFDPNRSILETMGIEGDNMAEEKQIYAEQKSGNISAAKIDYELIKNIVEGAVKKYIGALSKKMITENKSSENNIKAIQFNGDKFKLVTSKGDLYEAKMTFVKNINDK